MDHELRNASVPGTRSTQLNPLNPVHTALLPYPPKRLRGQGGWSLRARTDGTTHPESRLDDEAVPMRTLLRRLLRRRHDSQPTADIAVELTPYPALRPWQIRNRCFNIRRHGLDPAEIRAFLHRVADDLAIAQHALAAVQEENVRIKNALSAWQTEQAAYARKLSRR